MERPERYLTATFIFNKEQLQKATLQPNFEGVREINEVISVAIHRPEEIYLNKPTHVGVGILELSKLIMFKFFYQVILAKYGRDRVSLVASDTDSMILALRTKNLVRDIEEMKEHFDTSNYPPEHRLFSKENENRLFKVKDEAKGAAIVRFCGLKAKCYAFEYKQNGNIVEKRVAKGVQRSVINSSLRMNNYLSALKEEKKFYHESHTIRAKNNQLSTYKIRRLSLNSFDDKRIYLAPPNYKTWALNHYKYKLK